MTKEHYKLIKTHAGLFNKAIYTTAATAIALTLGFGITATTQAHAATSNQQSVTTANTNETTKAGIDIQAQNTVHNQQNAQSAMTVQASAQPQQQVEKSQLNSASQTVQSVANANSANTATGSAAASNNQNISSAISQQQNDELISKVRSQVANQIATLVDQQKNGKILYDWTDQNNSYQELALHDMAQLLAQGDVKNDPEVITSLLQKNDLLSGSVISKSLVVLPNQSVDIAKISSDFVTTLPQENLNGCVLGVGYNPTKNQVGIILFKAGKEQQEIKATSPVEAMVKVAYPAAGSTETVEDPLVAGSTIVNNDVIGGLTPFTTKLLNGKAGTTINETTLQTIFAGLAGNTTALDGARNYYAANGDTYHYEFWLAGANATDKENSFLALNKGVKYGQPIKVAYTATLTWGKAATQPATSIQEQIPASAKTSEELQLAYKTGGETGLRYDRVNIEKVPGMTENMIRGVDVSSYQSLLNAGVKFYDFNGKEASLFKVLKDSGVNWIRLRVWNDPYNAEGQPYAGGDNNEENLVKMAREASKYGLKLLIDFQYSDFWTDPAQQILPKAWKNLSRKDIAQEVSLYTTKILNDLRNVGASVNMVQIGNEITNGAFGLYTGRNGGGNWSSLWETSDGNQVAKYIQAGSAAVRRVDPAIKIAIQLETPEINKYRGIMTVLKKNNVDYDYLGTSYYAFWGNRQGNGWYNHVDLGYGASTPINLEAVEKMAWNEFGKKTVVLETGWLNNTNDADGTHNSVGEDTSTTNIDKYSTDPQGQVNAIEDMYKAIIAQNGVGAFYWEPAWIPVKAGWNNWLYNKEISGVYGSGWASQYVKGYAPDSVLYYNGHEEWGGSSWDNVSLFDDHGYPLQSLKVFNGMLNGYTSPKKFYGPSADSSASSAAGSSASSSASLPASSAAGSSASSSASLPASSAAGSSASSSASLPASSAAGSSASSSASLPASSAAGSSASSSASLPASSAAGSSASSSASLPASSAAGSSASSSASLPASSAAGSSASSSASLPASSAAGSSTSSSASLPASSAAGSSTSSSASLPASSAAGSSASSAAGSSASSTAGSSANSSASLTTSSAATSASVPTNSVADSTASSTASFVNPLNNYSASRTTAISNVKNEDTASPAAASLPQTGNENTAAVVALGALTAMFGLGLAGKKREY